MDKLNVLDRKHRRSSHVHYLRSVCTSLVSSALSLPARQHACSCLGLPLPCNIKDLQKGLAACKRSCSAQAAVQLLGINIAVFAMRNVSIQTMWSISPYGTLQNSQGLPSHDKEKENSKEEQPGGVKGTQSSPVHFEKSQTVTYLDPSYKELDRPPLQQEAGARPLMESPCANSVEGLPRAQSSYRAERSERVVPTSGLSTSSGSETQHRRCSHCPKPSHSLFQTALEPESGLGL